VLKRVGRYARTVAARSVLCYWDANGDGAITEEEYLGQVRKIMK